MTDEGIRKMADSIQRQACKHGAVVVLRDDRGRAAVLPGFDVQMIGVYSDGCKLAWLVDDLLHAEVTR